MRKDRKLETRESGIIDIDMSVGEEFMEERSLDIRDQWTEVQRGICQVRKVKKILPTTHKLLGRTEMIPSEITLAADTLSYLE